jgi:uncharacterized DUF497 family protein
MGFEYDPENSASNKAKHGIDFEQAKALWGDDRLIETPARDAEEPRRLAIGQIAGKLWTAIFTMRAGKVRLISVRRSRDREVDHYEDHQDQS